jgi:hypothetical protein
MMSEVERRRVKTADTALPDMLVDYLDLLLQDATTESDMAGAREISAPDKRATHVSVPVVTAAEFRMPEIVAPVLPAAPTIPLVSRPSLNQAPNPGLDATFDMAADCLQSLRGEIEAPHRFVMPAPSARTETFACLHVKVGPYTLLVPVDQVRRVEQVEKFDRFAGVSLPGLVATNYLLLTDVDLPGIYVDAVEGITRIEPDDVLWRRPSTRSPWFVGTHTTSLSRVFDPIYFLQRTRIGWR